MTNWALLANSSSWSHANSDNPEGLLHATPRYLLTYSVSPRTFGDPFPIPVVSLVVIVVGCSCPRGWHCHYVITTASHAQLQKALLYGSDHSE